MKPPILAKLDSKYYSILHILLLSSFEHHCEFIKKNSYRWYLKAHQINPKSGRPYNQLAILAVYAV